MSKTFSILFLGLKCPFCPGPSFCVRFSWPTLLGSGFLGNRSSSTHTEGITLSSGLWWIWYTPAWAALMTCNAIITLLINLSHYTMYTARTGAGLYFSSHSYCTQQVFNKCLMNERFSTPLLTRYVILGELRSLLIPQFPHMWIGLWIELRETMQNAYQHTWPIKGFCGRRYWLPTPKPFFLLIHALCYFWYGAAMRLERANLSFTQLGNSFDNDRFRGRLKTQSLLMKLEGISLGAL